MELKHLEKLTIDIRFKIKHFAFITRFLIAMFLAGFASTLYLLTSNPTYSNALRWELQEVKYQLRGINHPEEKQAFYSTYFLPLRIARKYAKKAALYSTAGGIALSIFAFILLTLITKQHGKRLEDEKYIRGAKIQKFKLNGRVRAGDFAIPEEYENRGTLILGTAGSGKSALTRLLLKSVRETLKPGDKMIIFDRKGEFIEHFYRDGDLILNFADKRTIKWNIFKEIEEERDIDSVAASLIPHTDDPKEKFWSNSARDIFKAVLLRIYKGNYSGTPSNKDLYNYFNKINTKEKLINSLKQLEEAYALAEGYLSEGETAASVFASFTEYANYFRNPDINYNGDFSIREWIREGEGVLFIANPPRIEDSYRALYTVFLDIAFKEVLSLRDDINRRIWLFIDEFPALFKLESLEKLLAEGRSKGSAPVLVAQDFTQVEKIYGIGANSIFNNSNTKVFFRISEPRSAEFISRFLGEQEVERTREGMTMGTENYRDGYMINRDIDKRQVVMPSELMNLEDLSFYYKIGHYPVGFTKIDYPVLEKVAEPFILREKRIYKLRKKAKTEDTV